MIKQIHMGDLEPEVNCYIDIAWNLFITAFLTGSFCTLVSSLKKFDEFGALKERLFALFFVLLTARLLLIAIHITQVLAIQ